MKRHSVFYYVIVLLLISVPSVFAKKLDVERIYSSPSLSGASMRGLQISPDGNRVTFLKGKDSDYERLDLWEYNIQTQQTKLLFDSDDLHSGKEALSDEEKARRERMRLSGSGIVSYQWSKDGTALLFPLAGDIYYYKVGDKKARKIISTPEFETDVRFSPKGNYISYIRDQNIFIFNLAKNKEIQLTKKGGGAIKFGMAEFVAQEEMGRMTGYWWSGDESKIAFTKVDESPVEQVTRSEIYADEIKMIQQRYPFAGKPNVKIELGVIAIKNKKIRWVDLGKEQDFYLPRVQWTKNSNQLSFQWQSRNQQTLKLNLYDWNTKKVSNILQETSPTWINLHKTLHFLGDKKHFIWASERSGFKHLYLYTLEGKLVKTLTQGDWKVDDIAHVDEDSKTIYFTGRKDTPIERHLYQVSFDSSKISKVTQKKGMHSIVFGHDGSSYIDFFSSSTTPPQVSLHRTNGERLSWLVENKVDKQHPLHEYLSDWVYPEFGTFQSADNTTLHYRLYKPANFNARKKYPVLVYLYGGPGAQMVTNSWTSYMPQYMAQQGYAVFTVDNRGSANRGKKFEDAIYQAMGKIEVSDQIEGVKFLRKLPWVDAQKIGVHGHSYGGYMTLMTMFKAADYFKAGVSGAPVTDWQLYDTHYTERYMGNPNQVPQAYEESSVFPYATNLQGPLLIYHGMADDNVLFKNATRLYKTLQDNNIQFYVMDYPGKKHSIRGKKTGMHRLNMIRHFFDLHFGIKR
ncbi:S9 family peptidase [Aliikangiella maris]|uniref:S9 family peptidase n=2 Tax=Aliikangiella maris TaxID=3162458 RepID=A0ABV2BX66_9GAMM